MKIRNAITMAKKTGRFSVMDFDPISLIIENNRKSGFPSCTYDRAAIYWNLKDFIESNKDDPKQKKNVARAEKILPQYEKHKYDPPVKRSWNPL